MVKPDNLKCPICIEEYTECLRKKVTCLYCQYTTCLKCAKTYLLSSILDPHCMNNICSMGWNTEFMIQNFHKTWYFQEYQQHRKEILFHREESRLHEAMDGIQLIKDAIFYRDEIIQIKEKDISNTHTLLSIFDYSGGVKTKELMTDLKQIHTHIYNARQLVERSQRSIWGNEDRIEELKSIIYD